MCYPYGCARHAYFCRALNASMGCVSAADFKQKDYSMLSVDHIKRMVQRGRNIEVAKAGDDDLGPLQLLPGVWENTDELQGHGWNLIALPFADGRFRYRLLMNQYNEKLHFTEVDKGVPNRGINADGQTGQTDQVVVALGYDQTITQLKGGDFPPSGIAGDANGKPIHKEPGLWLYMTNFTTDAIDIARLGSVPHGDSLLALGTAQSIEGAPTIPPVNGLPIGVSHDLENNPYLEPYKHFEDAPFEGVFSPVDATKLLRNAVPGNVVKTTVLHVDSTLDHAGVRNIPFIVRQADTTSMNSTFWIQETDQEGPDGQPRVFMQYVQSVMLDFFGRRDGNPGLIKWPHISINTMERTSNQPHLTETQKEVTS